MNIDKRLANGIINKLNTIEYYIEY